MVRNFPEAKMFSTDSVITAKRSLKLSVYILITVKKLVERWNYRSRTRIEHVYIFREIYPSEVEVLLKRRRCRY
jgi:hypothetical protein